LSSSYALGLALGSLMAGLTFDRLHPETAINVTGVIKLVGVAAAAMLLALDLNGAGNLSALYVVVVLIGASIDYSWSVTVCLFAYRFGGPVHCATLMGLQDAISFAFKIPMAFLFGQLHNSGSYTASLIIVITALSLAHLSIVVHLIMERRKPSVPESVQRDVLGGKLNTLDTPPGPSESSAAPCCVIL